MLGCDVLPEGLLGSGEVDQRGLVAVLAVDEVAGADVAVDDFAVVEVCEDGEGVLEKAENLGGVEAAGFEVLFVAGAVDPGLDEDLAGLLLVLSAEGFAVGGDAGMVEAVEAFGFVFDGLLGAAEGGGEVGVLGGEEVEGAVILAGLVGGFEAWAAGGCAELFEDFVAVEARVAVKHCDAGMLIQFMGASVSGPDFSEIFSNSMEFFCRAA